MATVTAGAGAGADASADYNVHNNILFQGGTLPTS